MSQIIFRYRNYRYFLIFFARTNYIIKRSSSYLNGKFRFVFLCVPEHRDTFWIKSRDNTVLAIAIRNARTEPPVGNPDALLDDGATSSLVWLERRLLLIKGELLPPSNPATPTFTFSCRPFACCCHGVEIYYCMFEIGMRSFIGPICLRVIYT